MYRYFSSLRGRAHEGDGAHHGHRIKTSAGNEGGRARKRGEATNAAWVALKAVQSAYLGT